MENCRDRGDRGVEEVSTEIENQGARNGALEQARLCFQSAARSTGVHERAQVHSGRPPGRPWKEAVDRPVDRRTGLCSRLGPIDRRGRPWHGSVDRPVDRRARFDFPFGIRIPFLDGIEFNLGFLKYRDFVAINNKG